ncbi:MAG TPA: glycoside hydrolase family 13 protein, partial [Bacteroidales bacterium]
MKKLTIFFFAAISFSVFNSCMEQQKVEETTFYTTPPVWAKNAIWYQIFVERFNNGDTTNDPTPETMYSASDFRPVPDDWSVTPWTHNWFEQEEWAKNLGVDFYGGLQLRRFGGDLQGVLDKLDYLQELGINAVYFNPLNDAPSLHKYDARNYHHIDVNFGPDPEGDMAIIASENPNDPSTWQWTAADKQFLQLVDELHKRGIKVVLDYSWNHTGVEFWAWKDLVKNQEKSEFKDWYAVNVFDDPETGENEFEYSGWLNLKSLPELKKVNTTEKHRNGYPFEGDLNPGAKQHVFDVTKRWLAPNGDTSKGIDGYRLDVADHVPMGFWRDYRKFVKNINPEAYLVGEIWWEDYPDDLMNPVPYLSGDVFDAVMFYQLYRPARYFFAETDYEITAEQLVDSLQFQWNRLQKPYRDAMMNTAATHDTPRLLTSFANPGMYKVNAKPDADPAYITGKPGEEVYQREHLYLIHQFTNVGAPHIWNGDEMGMWGGDDPDPRKPLWWPEYTFEPEYRNNIQPGVKTFDSVGFNQEQFEFYKKLVSLRKNNPVLSSGEIEFILAKGKTLAYKRFDQNDEIIVFFNLEDEPATLTLEEGKVYQNLFGNTGSVSEKIILEPLNAA